MRKRIFSLLLALVMVLGMLPTAALAQELTPAEQTAVTDMAPAADAGVSTQAEDEAAAIEIKQLTVRTTDSEGNRLHYNSAKGDAESGYWAYLVPGTTCPTTIPEEELKASSWTGCKNHVYTWDNGSYVQIALLEAYSISKIEWDSNVLKFTVSDGEGQTRDFTLTLKQRESLSGTTMAQLKDKVASALKTNMAESYAQLKEKLAAIEMPEGIILVMNTTEKVFSHTATAGTKDAPEGEAGKITLQILFYFVDETTGSQTAIKDSDDNYFQSIDVVDEPLVYSEEDKVTVTAIANGNGTVAAEYQGMVAQEQTDKSCKWVSQYGLTATQDEGQRFIVWLYGDAKQTNYTQNPTVSATENTTYTAYFVENQAPTAKKELSITVQARAYKSQSLYGYFNNQHKVVVDGKTYSKNVTLTYTATLDGKPMNEETLNTAQGEYFNSELGNFKVWPGNEMIGEHTIVITAHDDLGATAELTIPYTVTAGKISEYKLRLAATKAGKDYPLGEDGLNANITYKAGPNYQYLLDNLDNEYYDSTNKYLITIDKWSEIAEANNFYMLKVGSVQIAADGIPSKWTGYQLFGAKDGFQINYAKSMDQLQMYVNVNANMTITEDLTVELIFAEPATYTPTVTVSEAGGGTIASLKLYQNLDSGSTWTLTTAPNLSWVLDYIQIGDDETTRVPSEDGKTIRWTVSKADQNYTAYFREIPKAELTENWQLGGKADYARRSTSFGETGTFQFKAYSSYSITTDYPRETEKNTLIYTEQVNLVTEVDFKAEYPAGSVFKGVLYNGEGTTGEILDSRESKLSKALVPGQYGVDFTFDLPNNTSKVTMVLTLGVGSEGEFTLTKTFDLSETGITFRAPVESDYIQVAVQVGEAIGPIMVKDFKFYPGFKFLLGAYEEEMVRHPDAGYKSIVIDSVNGYMNCIVFSTDEPTIAGSVYSEKHFGSLTWGWCTYYVNGYFCDLGIGSWNFYGDEIMQWNGLYNTTYGAPCTTPFTGVDLWGVAVLRKYYSDAELAAAGVGSTIRTAEALAEKYPDHADEILNRKIIPDEVKEIFDPIVEKINAIGEVTKESATAITEARTALNNLPKTFFDSAGYLPALFGMADPYKTAKKTLEDAEAAFAALKDPDEQVIDKIAAIGEVTKESGEAILAARRAYDALTDAQKEKVTNYETLTTAESTYTTLQAAETAKLTDLNTIYTTTGNAIAANSANFDVGSTNGEWAVIGLARAGKTIPDSYYNKVLAYVQENIDKDTERLDENKATDNARVILALTAIGKDVTKVGAHDLLKGLNEMAYVQKQGLNGAIWTLIALNSHNYTPTGDVTCDKLVAAILDAQCDDGGWTLFGDTGDVDITGMVITALAPYYEKKDEVKTALDKALTALSNLQNADGTFNSSDGVATAESTAQVITALAALKIDPTSDSRFVKYGNSAVDGLRKFYVTGGGFYHTIGDTAKNDMATEQGYYALVANDRRANSKTSLYDMTDVTIEGATQPETPTCTGLTVSGTYKTQYTKGEDLDLTGIVLKATWSSGDPTDVALTDVTITGYDKTKIGEQEVTLTYTKENVSTTITVHVSESSAETITVTFTLLGDTVHTTSSDNTLNTEDIHTYRFNGDEMPKWVETTTVTLPSGSTVGDLFQKVLDEQGLTYKGLKNGYISSITYNGTKLSELTNGKLSGWMYVVNGKHPNVGLNAQKLVNGDVVIWHYTDNYTLEEGSTKYDSKSVQKYMESLIDLIGTVTLDSKAAIDQARKVYNQLTEAEKKTITNYKTLTDAEATYAQLVKDNAAAAAVVEKINAIGEVTPDSESAIKAAEAAYSALSDAQKALVVNYSKLTEARTAYDKLVAEIAAVIAQINAIGTVTLDSKAAIEAAETAYNKLTEAQKAKVTNYDKLTAARVAYDALAEQAAVDAVIEKIDAIGEVTLDSKSAIVAAETAYNKLTEAQKAKVTNYDKLTAARAAYDALVEASKPVTPNLPVVPSKPSTPAKPETPVVSFTDISGHWASTAIEYVVANGLMNGTGNGQFSPNANTTRGMIVTILARLEGVDTTTGASWYEAGQQWAMKLGISDGTSMDGQITREQLATMLYRYAQLKGYDVSVRADLSAFTDASSVSDWATEAMQWAVSVGLIQGSNNQLTPTAPATRAQVATILERYIENVAK